MTATGLETYLTDRFGELPYCPGCGHGTLARALNKALVKLQVDPRTTVLVTDIGCIGLTCKHFVTSAFHGLHGRSITYACGLKLAKPELNVITLMGDGGCGIGGTHLLNVARRNIGITLIVANNLNYGMTGGQHSVTTPTAGLTSTTPWGNIEAPMDLCGTTVAAGGAWVYRATGFDKNLVDVLVSAIRQPTFSMVEVWELCSAYYQPRNELKKKELLGLLDSYGFSIGLQADKSRPEYSERYRQAYEAGKGVLEKKPPISPRFDHKVAKQTGIVIAGSAGQKIKSTATLLAEGAIFAGLKSTQKDDYPITVQTGHSVAEIILSPNPIEYTGIDAPDLVVIVSADGLSRIRRRLAELPPTCIVYASDDLDLPDTPATVKRFAFRKIGEEVNKLSLVTGALATMLADSGLYPVAALNAAIAAFQKPKIATANVAAANLGAGLASSG